MSNFSSKNTGSDVSSITRRQGEAVKRALDLREMTVRAGANLLGLKESTFGAYVRGERKMPTKVKKEIVKKLGVPAHDLDLVDRDPELKEASREIALYLVKIEQLPANIRTAAIKVLEKISQK